MLVLCDHGDAAAYWAAARLLEQGVAAEILTATTLGAATGWEHRIDASTTSVAITFADGRCLSSDTPSPILNRLSFAPTERLRAAAGDDYGYAVQETFAFYLSWLNAWPGVVINRPTPQGLCGDYRHPSWWTTFGARVGLPVAPWTQGSEDTPTWIATRSAEATVFVVDGGAIVPPALPPAFREPCVKLAARAGAALLGVDFVREGDAWVMVAASPTPNLVLGGEPLIDLLIERLG